MSDIIRVINVAVLEGVTPKKDGSWSMRFNTNVPTEAQQRAMIDAMGSFGVMVFFPDKESLHDIEIEELSQLSIGEYEKPNKITASKRLRNAIYRHFEDKTEVPEDKKEALKKFNEYYQLKMDQFTNYTLNQIES